MVDTTTMNYYINIIADNSNCTAELRKFDKKKPPYRLCKSMAKRIGDVIDAYVPPVPVIPETRRRYSLRSLGLADDNFNFVTGGDDFYADNNDDTANDLHHTKKTLLKPQFSKCTIHAPYMHHTCTIHAPYMHHTCTIHAL